jgi:hypothetical protein
VVLVEVALAVVVSAGAILLSRSFLNLILLDPGFDPDQVLTALVDLPPSRYPGSAEQLAFAEDLTARLQALPGQSLEAHLHDRAHAKTWSSRLGTRFDIMTLASDLSP